MAEAGRLCPKAGQAKRPGGVKKASVLMKDRDTKMCPILLEDEGQTVQLHRSLSAVPLRLLRSGTAMHYCRKRVRTGCSQVRASRTVLPSCTGMAAL